MKKNIHYSKTNNANKTNTKFTSELSAQIKNSVPSATTAIEAILWHTKMLIIESGIKEPPYTPAIYASIRNIKEIKNKPMQQEGQLIPNSDGTFNIELRSDRSQERKNFTCCHEIAHTFFYEISPSIKYRNNTNYQDQPTKNQTEEEILCNISAAELLMPQNKLKQIIKNYQASPESIVTIAKKFQASLTSTIIRIHTLNIWKETFILWKITNGQINAEWKISSNKKIHYNPNIQIKNAQKSSIYKTLQTGKTTNDEETILDGNQNKTILIESTKINTNLILSVIKAKNTKQENNDIPLLPLNYECECNGTGWKPITFNNTKYVIRCKAKHHKS